MVRERVFAEPPQRLSGDAEYDVRMRAPWMVASMTAVVVVAGVATAVVASRGGRSVSVASPAMVTHVFAERGITIRSDSTIGLTPSVHVRQPIAGLSTRLNQIAHGNLDIVVLGSLEDAKRVGPIRMNVPGRDVWGARSRATCSSGA